MSTRANIIIKDEYDELIFYRHSDGYPEGTLPTLEKFLQWVKDKRIRDDLGQAAGWLILIGREEDPPWEKSEWEKVPSQDGPFEPGHDIALRGWKVGTYEPTTGIHGDIEYLYVINLETKAIHIDGKDGYEYKGKFALPPL